MSIKNAHFEILLTPQADASSLWRPLNPLWHMHKTLSTSLPKHREIILLHTPPMHHPLHHKRNNITLLPKYQPTMPHANPPQQQPMTDFLTHTSFVKSPWTTYYTTPSPTNTPLQQLILTPKPTS